MWTAAIAAILTILTGVCYALSNHYASINDRTLEKQYLYTAFVLAGLDILLIIIKLGHWWFSLRFMRRPAESERHDQSPPLRGNEKFKFGVYWDSDLNPLCPVCKTPLILSRDKLIYRIDGGVPLPVPEPHCFKCNKLLLLHDDDGNHLTLGEAKKLVSPTKPEPALESAQSQPLLDASSENRQGKRPQIKQEEDYQPDEMERSILAYLFKDRVDRDLGSIIRALNIASTEEAKFHLEQLVKYHYIDAPVRFRPSVRPNYSLRQKGREFVIQNNLHREEVKPATAPQPPQLQTSKPLDLTDSYRPDETAIKILMALEKDIAWESELARDLKLDLAQVVTSLRLLEQHEYIRFRHPPGRGPYYVLTPKGRDFLNQPDYRGIPHPSEHAIIDATKQNLLQLFTRPDCSPTEQWLSRALLMNTVQLQVHLSDLMQHGYVDGNAFDEYGEPLYRLTDKARRFLVKRNLID
jgi:hypothetical protein